MKTIVKTKTFWSGIAAIGFGIALCAQGNFSEGGQSIIAGVGLIFLRQAVGKDTKTEEKKS